MLSEYLAVHALATNAELRRLSDFQAVNAELRMLSDFQAVNAELRMLRGARNAEISSWFPGAKSEMAVHDDVCISVEKDRINKNLKVRAAGYRCLMWRVTQVK
ncbi:hypothetical protein NDU88_011717 [Pleurodeles waltl]|uniref:Uncharacterized protein n=1 Tax=Pleurodeles waltl TaxID=8319 RepID=A0AAV7S4J3_PLEWA|nr:hypothetical protein NDU88_011717 [Pleurodeles waltl]